MALLIAYTLHDVKALTYSPPFFASNDQIARRMVTDVVSDPNTTVGRHPADFKLCKIGTFDEASAVLQPFMMLEHVVDCIALVPPPAPDMFTSADVRRAMSSSRANGEAR